MEHAWYSGGCKCMDMKGSTHWTRIPYILGSLLTWFGAKYIKGHLYNIIAKTEIEVENWEEEKEDERYVQFMTTK